MSRRNEVIKVIGNIRPDKFPTNEELILYCLQESREKCPLEFVLSFLDLSQVDIMSIRGSLNRFGLTQKHELKDTNGTIEISAEKIPNFLVDLKEHFPTVIGWMNQPPLTTRNSEHIIYQLRKTSNLLVVSRIKI